MSQVYIQVSLLYGGDEYGVEKRGRERPTVYIIECKHGGPCPRPGVGILPPVPMAVASPRVLKAMAEDWLDAQPAVFEGRAS